MTMAIHNTKSATTKARKPIPKPGRKLSFEEGQKLIMARFGPAFAKLAK